MLKALEITADTQKYSALIFDIKRYAINDGPGIRTTIFIKGCPLSCAWCHNPESRSAQVEKMYAEAKCIGCGQCIEVCSHDACTMGPHGIITDKDLCIVCGNCADSCPTKASEMSGHSLSVSNIMTELEKERIFFDQSGGGVTFSGGEPLMFPGFLIMLLDACGQRCIHRTVDTCGYAKPEVLSDVAKRTELFLYDLKMMDAKKHKKYTGVDNKVILENLRFLAEKKANIIVRIPLIKDINDDDKNIKDSAYFISQLPGEKIDIELLPYHNVANHKHKKLGQPFEKDGLAAPAKEKINHIISLFKSHGIQAKVN